MKRLLTIFLLVSLTNCTSANSGELLIIGGGKRPASIMEKFIELAGSENSNILIIPMASSDPIGTAQYQQKEMIEYGAAKANYLIFTKEEANKDSLLIYLNDITGIFFSGGDQNRLTNILLNTKFLERIMDYYVNGGLIAGTSAGAAIMSNVMITGDEYKNKNPDRAFETIESKNIITAQGFGFLDNCIIDQHFIKRRRHNRLISVVLDNPSLVGIGIDESTAALVLGGKKLEVLGENQVVIYDAKDAINTSINRNGKFSSRRIIMNILTDGDKYNIHEPEISK